MWLKKYDVFKLSFDYRIEVSSDFFGTDSCWVSTLLSVGSVGLVKVDIYPFLFVKWPRGWRVTWICGWCPFILSHHTTKFGVHRPFESENITFFICHVTKISKYHVTFWVGPLTLSYCPTKLGIHRTCESGDSILFVTWLRYQSIIWLCGWGLLIVNDHPTKFRVHRPYETGNKTFVISVPIQF